MLFWVLGIVIAVLGLQMVLQLLCVRMDTRKFPLPGTLVKTASGTMHVQQSGSGSPPVILEAGIAASSLNWSILQPQLARLTSTYSYDRAGLGWSTHGSYACTLQRMSDGLHEMVGAAGIATPYVLIGHSYSAYIIRLYAQRFPEELAGVILVDPLTPEEWIKPKRFQRWRLRRGAWFSRAGGVLGALGVVRFSLWLLQRG